MKWNDPKYYTESQIGTENKKFIMCVKNNDGETIGQGIGTSKKKGEQGAAKQALIKLGELVENSVSDNESDCSYEFSDVEDEEVKSCYSLSDKSCE